MNLRNFFAELRRRNVYKVAVAYAVVGWVIAQIATQIFPFLEIPNWIVRLVIILIAIGFPIALVLAWAFELTPQGIERTEVADRIQAAAGQKKYAWIYVAIVGAVLSIGLFFLGRYGFRNASPSSTELPAKSIAVLPFDNLSRDPDNAYFAEGVQDEILTRLAKVADLKVISRTSTQRFKTAPDNLPQIAKQLGVMHILEGSVQKANDQVRVNVQLINALTDAHLWADTYDRKLIDIFSVESDIAKTIADTLQAKLTGSEKQMIAAQPTTDTAAYELYPNDATAHHCLGNVALSALGRFEEAIAQGKRAVELDPLSPVINTDLDTTFYYAHRYEESAKQSRMTLEIDPTFFYAHFNLGIALQAAGDLSGAITEYEKAKQLGDDTYVPMLCAQAKAYAGDKDAALRMLNDLDKISQHREVVGYCRALLYLSLNNKDEALRWLEQGLKERDGSNISWIKVDPLLDPLHGDPRFEALVQKVIAQKTELKK